VRRGVAKRLVLARHGLEGPGPVPDLHRREEARRIRELDRRRLYELTFDALPAWGILVIRSEENPTVTRMNLARGRLNHKL
jgi:hypothetical protein